jgi:hypothetical protein
MRSCRHTPSSGSITRRRASFTSILKRRTKRRFLRRNIISTGIRKAGGRQENGASILRRGRANTRRRRCHPHRRAVVSEARILQVRARAQASAGIKGRRHRESRFAARGIGGARAAARSRFGRSRSGWWCRRQWSERSGASRLIATAAIRTAIDAPLVSCCAASTSRLIRPNAFDNHLRSLAGLRGRRPSGRLGAEGRRMLGGKAKA